MEVKATFHFASEAVDSKTTVVKVKTIQLEGRSEAYQFPLDQQTRTHHSKLFDHKITKLVVKSLTTRNKYRKVNITLKEGELLEEYLDEEGNVVFNEFYLEVFKSTSLHSPSPPIPPSEKSMHSIAKNFVLNKFDGNDVDAESWLNTFEQECERLGVQEEKYSEILRLCLENVALEWYAVFLKINNLSHAWEFWKASFVDTFGSKSWSEITFAYTYKYLGGSILDYALKKRNLLIDVDPDLSVRSQINLIVIDLPNYIKTRLERKDLTKVDDLMSKLRQIDPSRNKAALNSVKNPDEVQRKSNKIFNENLNEQKTCGYCDKMGFPGRRHSEEVCRAKIAHQSKNKNNKIKVANNIEAQDAISLLENPKN